MPSSRSVAAALVLALTCAAGVASAESNEASAHHRSGVAYARNHKWEEAVREFDEAYKIDPTPLRLYDVAQVCLQAKQYVRARDAYAKVADDPQLPPDQQQRARAGLALAKSNIGRLRIAITDAKASDVVTIDGVKARSEVVDVDPGKHTVRLVRDGEASEAAVDVTPGTEATATLGAAKKEEPRGSGGDDGATEPSSGGIPAGAWIFTGIAVAALGTGISLMVIGNNEYEKVRESGCAPDCKGAEDAGQQKALVGDILVGVGAVSAAAAAYFFITAATDSPRPKRATSKRVDWSVAGLRGGAFVGLSGRF